jgi:hypothetical protein
MDYTKLKSELTVDPLGRGYAAMTAEHAAENLNTADRTRVIAETFVNAKTLYSRLGAVAAETVIQKLEAGAASDSPFAPVLKRAVQWILPSEEGIDVGNAVTRGLLDQLAGPLLTAEEAAAIKAIAEETVSRATELGLPKVEPGHVQDARRL